MTFTDWVNPGTLTTLLYLVVLGTGIAVWCIAAAYFLLVIVVHKFFLCGVLNSWSKCAWTRRADIHNQYSWLWFLAEFVAGCFHMYGYGSNGAVRMFTVSGYYWRSRHDYTLPMMRSSEIALFRLRSLIHRQRQHSQH